MLLKIFNHFRLVMRLFWDGKVSLFLKLFLLGVPVVYFILPLPDDVMPVVGMLDDFAFMGLSTLIFTAMCPSDRVSHHRSRILGVQEDMEGVDRFRHPEELRSLGTGFAIIFGFLALGGYLAGFLGLLLFGMGYLTTLLGRGQMLGNAMQVTQTQYPEIYSAFTRASQGLPAVKMNLFVTQRPDMNAYTFGYEEPYTIVLTSGLVEKLTLDEMRSVIAHELGHILLGHVRFTSLMSGGRGLFSLIFYRWSRACEYSADAVALHACHGVPETYISALIKISSGLVNRQVDVEQFLEQGRDSAPMNKPAEWASTHPFIINRIQRIVELACSGGWTFRKNIPAIA